MSGIKNAVSRMNQKMPVSLAAALLSASLLVSSFLGFFRDRLLNGYYYKTYPVGIDAYTVAFTIPDFMYFILVSGALSVTFIPVFNQRLSAGNRKSAWALSTSLINFMALVTLLASILIMIFAEPLVRYVVGPGLDESGRALAVSMMRVIAVNPFLFAIATVITSMQQAIGRFTFYALAPTIYNVGIIIGILAFTNGIHIFGYTLFEGGIMGVALGVVLGAVLQLLVSAIGLLGLGFDYQFKIYWKNTGFRRVLKLLPARSLDQGADYFYSIVEVNLASRMAAGTVRAYQQATALHMVPVSLIGVAISTAVFPELTASMNEGATQFRQKLQMILRIIIWLALPTSVITYFTRGYLVNFLINGGDVLMAGLLGLLALSILFRSIYHISARSFYAQQDTRTPLYISIFAISFNILGALLFTQVFDMGAYGLAWAQALTAAVEVGVLFFMMARRMPEIFDKVFIHAIARMASAAGFMAVVCYICVLMLPLRAEDRSFTATFPKFAAIGVISLGSYLVFSYLFKLEEAMPVVARLRTLLFSSDRYAKVN